MAPQESQTEAGPRRRGYLDTSDEFSKDLTPANNGAPTVKYTFGSVCVDADARTISSAAGPVRLTRKAFDLLLLLLDCRPKAVSKEQIYARLWPETFVTESSLQTLVHEIRNAIDDRHAQSSWIRTVHGIGYCFDGDVVVGEPQPPAERPGRPAAWLVGESIRVALDPGENIVGRTLDEGIAIDAPTISRRHARITIRDSVTIEDLGSKNGTWFEDERLTMPRELSDGDVVRLGSVRFTFRLARQPRATESAEFPRAAADPTPE
jgi:DNA-binding winged helix-turn-helix (wHTH) protein